MKKFLPFGLILGISLVLILIWFKDGRVFAGGDVGFQTYNPQRILENARFVWWDASAPGTVMPQGLTAVPLQFGLSVLQFLGFGPVALQASLFFILLALMGSGMYLFLSQKLKGEHNFYAYAGTLFYMFNPYMFVQVWHRFVHTGIILAAVLPFLALFWDRWIRQGRIRDLMLFLLINIASVYIYGTYAYVVTVWIFLFLITLGTVVPFEGRKTLFAKGGKFLVGLIFWLAVNAWWMIPSVKISPALLSEQHKSAESVINLIMISGQAILPYSLSLLNPFYLFYQAEFGPIYKNPFFAAIPFIFTAVILLGVLRAFKSKAFPFFGILFLFALYLAKGAAPPLGALYIFGFKNFFALGILRNPFEKTGLILVFFATVLFVIGLSKFKNKFLTGAILASVIFFSWPMLAGKVFGRIDKKGDVEVPSGYKEADAFLKEKRMEGIKDGNILHLPLTRGESVRYNWQYGYNGLESSDQFFTSHPSISRGFNIQRVDDSLTALSMIFTSGEKNKILKLLRDFNVRFIVLHKDLNWRASDVYDPLQVEKILNNLSSFLKKAAEFGDLVLYQVNDEAFGELIEIASNPSLVYPAKASTGIWPWLSGEGNMFLSDENIKNMDGETIVFAQDSFSYPNTASDSAQVISDVLAALGNLSSTAVTFKQLGIVEPKLEKLLGDISLSSQKLMEGSWDEYAVLMDNLLPEIGEPSIIYIERIRNEVISVLKLHEAILQATKRAPEVKQHIRDVLNKEKTLPSFWPQVQQGSETQYFDFILAQGGQYEVLMADSASKDNYEEKLSKLNFLINGEGKTLEGKFLGNLISYGMADFKEGFNEISLSNPRAVNLSSAESPLTLAPEQQQPAIIDFPLKETTGGDVYELSFKGQVPAGATFFIQILQDSDEEQNGAKVPRISTAATGQTGLWQNYKLKLPSLSPVTREATLRLAALNGPVTVKDLRLARVLNNKIFLKKGGAAKIPQVTANLTYDRISAVEYKGHVSLQEPAYLLFKQTFHPGWKLTFTSGSETKVAANHYLGQLYANAWYIERAGNYDFTITFEPQNYLYYGLFISVSVFVGLTAFGIVKRKRESNAKS